MKSSTRMTKGKIVVEAGKQLTPDAFPLGNWIPGRRRVPSQERSLRTRKQILAAAETLAKSEGVGNITMQMIASKAKIGQGWRSRKWLTLRRRCAAYGKKYSIIEQVRVNSDHARNYKAYYPAIVQKSN